MQEMSGVELGAVGLPEEIEEIFRRAKETAMADAKIVESLRAVSVMSLSMNFDPAEEIFKFDFLSRGEGMLFVGETGIGKSSLMMQGACLWALGRDLYQIKPARPLTTLIVQAENHEKELAKEVAGVVHGLSLTKEERQTVGERVFTRRITSATGAHLVEKMRVLLSERQYDLVILDPANSYHGGDTNSQKDMSKFLREEINLLAEAFRVGFIVVHHTNKPPKTDGKSTPAPGAGKYAGSGSSEFGNWARGVWTLTTTEKDGAFAFACPKRGGAMNWRNSDDEKIYVQYLAHSGEEMANGQEYAYWRLAEFEELPESKKVVKPKVEQRIAALFFDAEEKITQEEFIERAKKAGVAETTCRRWWKVTGVAKNVFKIGRDGKAQATGAFLPAPDLGEQNSEDFYG